MRVGNAAIMLGLVACGGPSSTARTGSEQAPRAPLAVSPDAGGPVSSSVATRDATAPAASASVVVSDAPPAASAPQLTVARSFQQVRTRPRWDAPVIGLIRGGQTVSLKSGQPASGETVQACAGGWYEVEPHGWVCVGMLSSLRQDDPDALVQALALPNSAASYPYRYGVSTGSPRYRRIPTLEQQRFCEPGLDEHLARVAPPSQPAAPVLTPEQRDRILAKLAQTAELRHKVSAHRGMKIAWVAELTVEGRTWLVTPRFLLVPRDKVTPHRELPSRGWDLRHGHGPDLPFAVVHTPTGKLVRNAAGSFVERGQWTRHEIVPTTGKRVRHRLGVLLETRDQQFVPFRAASSFAPATVLPEDVGPNDKWVSIRTSTGALVAYRGKTPVFAARVSVGASLQTPTGHYRISRKLLTDNMTGTTPRGSWHTPYVPWVAYFHEGYALHGAWWHDQFGRPRSHGCINLAPADARLLFEWVDPPLPPGWHGVYARPVSSGTLVVIRS